MIVSELIADLNTLQPPACDSSAALALVSASSEANNGQGDRSNGARKEKDDQDLQRAKDLLNLHASVKLAQKGSIDQELNDARTAVQKVLRDL